MSAPLQQEPQAPLPLPKGRPCGRRPCARFAALQPHASASPDLQEWAKGWPGEEPVLFVHLRVFSSLFVC